MPITRWVRTIGRHNPLGATHRQSCLGPFGPFGQRVRSEWVSEWFVCICGLYVPPVTRCCVGSLAWNRKEAVRRARGAKDPEGTRWVPSN